MTVTYTREELVRWFELACETVDMSALDLDTDLDEAFVDELDCAIGTNTGAIAGSLVDAVKEQVFEKAEADALGEEIRNRMNVVAAIFGYLCDHPEKESTIHTAEVLYDAFEANWGAPYEDNVYITEVLAPGTEFDALAERWQAEAEADEDEDDKELEAAVTP